MDEAFSILAHPPLQDGFPDPVIPQVSNPMSWSREERGPLPVQLWWRDQVIPRTVWELTTVPAAGQELTMALHLARWGRALSRLVWGTNLVVGMMRSWGWRVRYQPSWDLVVADSLAHPLVPRYLQPHFSREMVEEIWAGCLATLSHWLGVAEEHWSRSLRGEMVWSLTPIPGAPKRVAGSDPDSWGVTGLARIHWRAGLAATEDGSKGLLLYGLLRREEEQRVMDRSLWPSLIRLQNDEGKMTFHGPGLIAGRPHSLTKERLERSVRSRADALEPRIREQLVRGPVEVPVEVLVAQAEEPESLAQKVREREPRIPKPCSERRSPKPRCQCEHCKILVSLRNARRVRKTKPEAGIHGS